MIARDFDRSDTSGMVLVIYSSGCDSLDIYADIQPFTPSPAETFESSLARVQFAQQVITTQTSPSPCKAHSSIQIFRHMMCSLKYSLQFYILQSFDSTTPSHLQPEDFTPGKQDTIRPNLRYSTSSHNCPTSSHEPLQQRPRKVMDSVSHTGGGGGLS